MFLQQDAQWKLIEHSRTFFANEGADWHLMLFMDTSKHDIPQIGRAHV